MKKLLSILIIVLSQALLGQNCMYDVGRHANYEHIEVLNRTTGKYESFNKNKITDIVVKINSEKKVIHLEDEANHYDKSFSILGCLMAEESLTYECVDLDNNRRCQLIFSASTDLFELTITYQVSPVSYKVSRKKQTN